MKSKIRTTVPIMAEVCSAIMTAIMGHPAKMGKKAKNVYRRWAKRSFKLDAIEIK